MVSNGTMSVAMTTVSRILRPRHSSRDSAKPAMLLTISPSPTMSTVTHDGVEEEPGHGDAVEHVDVVLAADVPDRQERRRRVDVGRGSARRA